MELSQGGRGCSFETFLAKYRLDDPALRRIATIVRAADNDNLALAPEAAGLRAISFGLAGSIRDDQERVSYGLVLYDALYRWSRKEGIGIAAARPERGLALWMARYRERRALATLDDRMLEDMGIRRAEATVEECKPFWRP